MRITELVGSCINVVFSADCPVCETHMIEYPSAICRECKDALIAGDVLPVISSCYVTGILSCRPYNGVIRECIKLLKYRRRRRMIHAFEEMVRDSLTSDTLRMHPADVLIPVPIHRARRRKRGFNQAELIAELLSRILSVPVSSGNLLKTKNTIPQTGLTGKYRPINLKNSFSVLTPSTLAGKSIILVDDVRTTGATLDACAVELQNAGVKKISAFTLARTL